MSEGKPARRWTKRLLRTLPVLLAAVALAVALLFTGLPQRALLTKVLGRVLNANVEIRGLSLLGNAKIGELKAFDKNAEASSPPLLDVSGIQIDYTLFPPAGKKRYISSLSIDNLYVNLDRTTRAPPPAANAAPAKPEEGKPSKRGWGDLVPFIPQAVNIANLQFDVATPSLGARMTGHARLSEAYETDIDLNLERFVTAGMDLSSPSPGAPAVPCRFEKLDMSGTRINVAGELKKFRASIAGTKICVIAENLSLGPKGQELYEGNLAITGSSAPSSDLGFDIVATLNRNQKLTAALTGSLNDFDLRASLKDWSREDLLAVLPKDAQVGVNALPGLRGLSAASLDASFRFLNFDMKGSVTPIFLDIDGVVEPVEFSFDTTGATLSFYSGTGHFDTHLRAKLGDGSIALSTVLGPAPRKRVTFNLDQVEPARWLRTIMQLRELDALNTALSGTVDIDATPDWKLIYVVMDLSAPSLRYGSWATPEGQALKVAGSVTADNSTYWKLAIPAIEARLGDRASVALKDTTVDVESISVKSDLTAECDLSLLGHGLGGRAKLHAPIENERGMISADLDLAVDGLGLGAFATLTDTPVTAKGAVVYDNINGYTKSGNIELKLGEETSLVLSNIAYDGSPLRVETPFALKTDLQPLVSTGWLDAVKGTATASGTFKHEGALSSATCDLEIACETVSMAKGRCALDGVSLKGAFGWANDKALSGNGELKAVGLSAGGIALNDIAGSIQAAGDAIKATGLTGKAFDGSVTGDAELGVLGSGRPVRLTAQLKGVNLESMSRDLAIPSMKLTGSAEGAVELAMDQEGIRELDFSLESAGGVTISVAILEQLLTSPYVQQFTGKKQLERVVKEVVGKEEQSPFDSAKLTLTSGGDRYTIRVELVNAKVNLTVDVLVDAASVMDALKLIRQTGGIAVVQS